MNQSNNSDPIDFEMRFRDTKDINIICPIHKWNSVNDRLPEECEVVLVFIPVYPGISLGKVRDNRIRDIVHGYHHNNPVTHWMPLPSPSEISNET